MLVICNGFLAFIALKQWQQKIPLEQQLEALPAEQKALEHTQVTYQHLQFPWMAFPTIEAVQQAVTEWMQSSYPPQVTWEPSPQTIRKGFCGYTCVATGFLLPDAVVPFLETLVNHPCPLWITSMEIRRKGAQNFGLCVTVTGQALVKSPNAQQTDVVDATHPQ